MTAGEIIEEIKRLPRDERNRVVEFARHAAESPPLSPEELGQLARRMVEAQDPAEADRLQEEIVRGFYGGQSHAYNPPPQTSAATADTSSDPNAPTEHLP